MAPGNYCFDAGSRFYYAGLFHGRNRSQAATFFEREFSVRQNVKQVVNEKITAAVGRHCDVTAIAAVREREQSKCETEKNFSRVQFSR